MQDAMREDDLPLAGWTEGPLPDQALEQIAFDLFRFRFPQAQWYDPLFKTERNDCRRLTLQLRIKFLTIDRWNPTNALERLTDESCRLVFGDRRLGSKLRNEIRSYAESYLEDLAKLFGDRLFYDKDIASNARDLEEGDGHGHH